MGGDMCKGGTPLFGSAVPTLRQSTVEGLVTFGEMSWLLLGALLGGAPAYGIAAAITLIERLVRRRVSAAAPPPPSTPAWERALYAVKLRVSD